MNENKQEKNENLHKNHRNRLRKELLSTNFQVVNEHKLLEFMLFKCYQQIDTNPLAHRLINTFGSFANVLEASYNDLLKVEGIGPNTAADLVSYLPIFNFYKNQKANGKSKLTTTKDFVNHFAERLKNSAEEQILAILLNEKYDIKKNDIINLGTENSVEMNGLKIAKFAIENESNKIIIMHNHPSGNPNPSSQDFTTTESLIKTLGLLKISLLDHIIVASSGYFSFKEAGLIDEYMERNRINPNM